MDRPLTDDDRSTGPAGRARGEDNSLAVDQPAQSVHRPITPGNRWFLSGAVLAAAGAAAITGYLLVVSLASWGQPLGCGSGSGCAEVLGSRWAEVLGIPVSAAALGVDLAVIALCVLALTRNVGWETRPLAVLAGCLLAAAIWFLGLQWFAVGAFCPWCVAAHALGVLSALLILAGLPQSIPRTLPHLLTGVLLGAVLAGLQVWGPQPVREMGVVAGAQGQVRGEAGARQLTFLDGALEFELDEVPRLGPVDAPHVIVVLNDYCCPHCREAHNQLLEALAKSPGELAIVLLPAPLDADCNPAEEETSPRFEDSCELAELALALWRVDPQAFETFDRWLYETPQPRPIEQATARAIDLVGQDALAKGLADPWVQSRISKNVQAYLASEANLLPVLLSPGIEGRKGRPSHEEIESLLAELGVGSD